MKNVIILGSGRSGTSMLAGTVASGADYYIGTDYIRPRNSNPKGFFEAEEVNVLNEAIIRSVTPWPTRAFMHRARSPLLRRLIGRSRVPTSGQMWLACIPVHATFPTTAKIKHRIEELTAHEPFCFKDPRFSYTLPVWRPFLRNTVFLCVFRSPAETVASILKECRDEAYLHDITIDATIALEVWELMYRHIIEVHRHQGDWLFLHFAQLFEPETIGRLATFIDAPIKSDFPDRTLRRSHANAVASPEAERVYRQLCELAGYAEG